MRMGPRCPRCGLDMIVVKHQTWRCSFCGITFRRISKLQQYCETISMYDQWLVEANDVEIKKYIQKQLKKATEDYERMKILEQHGFTFEDMEEWQFDEDSLD